MHLVFAVLTQASAGAALAQVLTYEGDSVFPEDANPSWERVGTFDATRWLSDGMLWIDVDLGVWAPPPGGEQDAYRREIPEFQGVAFFVEWRCRSNAPNSEIQGTGGSVINSAGSGGVSFHFTITEDMVRFWRSNFLPILYFTISPDRLHTYRVETIGAESYKAFLDGELVDSGTPPAAFPNPSARIIWGAKMWNTPSINEWDYVRYGRIPQDGSGDFDSDGGVGLEDYYFFAECLGNTGPALDAGPGCRFADIDADTDVDLADFAAFQTAFSS